MNAFQPRTLGPGNLRGLLLMVFSTLCMSCMHSLIRYVTADLHPFEVTFFRCAFGLVVVVPWLARQGLTSVRTQRFSLHLARAAINIGSMMCFFWALSLAPLTDVTALGFLSPLAATALAAVLLHERVGMRRWTAIVVGFAGALIVLRPGFAAIGQGQVLTLISVVLWAVVLIIIKVAARTDSAVAITAWMSLLMAPLALVPALFYWTWPSLTQLGWLLVIGVIGNIGQIAMTQALKEGETAVVMPIDFLKLVWITGIAYFAFGEVPGLYSWAGGAIIFAAGAYVAMRESRRREVAQPPSRPEPAA
jgi:drug/metabolite transporter (DMT)-like permease